MMTKYTNIHFDLKVKGISLRLRGKRSRKEIECEEISKSYVSCFTEKLNPKRPYYCSESKYKGEKTKKQTNSLLKAFS